MIPAADRNLRSVPGVLAMGLLLALAGCRSPKRISPSSRPTSRASQPPPDDRPSSVSRPAPSPPENRPDWIEAGPMLGHVGPGEARVWLRLPEGSRLDAEAVQEGRALPRPEIADLGDRCLVLHVGSLLPGTETRVLLRPDPARGEEDTRVLRFRTAPRPGGRGIIRLAFGSCANLGLYRSAPVFQAVADLRPDCMLMLGDNIYYIVGDGSRRNWNTTGPDGDWNHEDRMLARQLALRRDPFFLTMASRVPVYAIWDDHDFGPNNSGAAFPHKDTALRVFQKVWANPGYGAPGVPGVFGSFRRGPVEVFLMDDRYYKSVRGPAPGEERPGRGRIPNGGAEDSTIWGAQQFTWLCEGLKRSTAAVKIVANGTQLLSLENRGEGHWREARGELERLIAFLVEHRIGGVVFLSGDRHFSELMRIRRKDGAALLEMTSSPLQQGRGVGPLKGHGNPARIWGATGNGFGLLTIEVEGPAKGRLIFEMRDARGRLVSAGGRPCRSEFPLADLLPRAPR